MPHICPRSCSRLATAAVFISVGVVQFIVGIILLRSKYIYVLAGPDFWTSSCNIAVGCLLGVTATVWKQSKKRQSKKHVIRRNVLLALIFSALVMNATTLAILLLGKGNKLLSIRLESDGRHSEMSLGSEILAYAYVTSVCCPVVCIVISIVSISGSCFNSTSKNGVERKLFLNSLKKNRSRSLQWVYDTEDLDVSEKKARVFVSTSPESSSDDDDSEDIYVQQKHANSTEELQRVLNRMAEGTRDSILRDSTTMLKQMELRRKNRYDSLNADGSYMGPVPSLMRESTADKMSVKSPTNSNNSKDSKTGNYKYSGFDKSTPLPPEEASLKHVNHSRSKQPDILHRYPYAKNIKEYQNTSQLSAKNASPEHEKLVGKLQHLPEPVESPLDYNSDVTGHYPKSSTVTTRKKSKMSKIEAKKKSASANYRKRKESSRDNCQIICETKGKQSCEVNKYKEASPVLNDCFSPDGSEFSADSPFEIYRASSWAGDVIPISINNSSVAVLSRKLIPVASPVVPSTRQQYDLPKISDDSGIFSIQSTSFNGEIANRNEFKDKENLSSFRETVRMENEEKVQEYPKAERGSQNTKKYDLRRVVTMASISEEPHLELNHPEPKPHSSSFCEATTPKKSHRYTRQLSLPSVFSGSYKGNQDEESSEKNGTPKRKRNASGRVLRKLWSVAIPENQMDFLDQVVDDDSLIGLTEEELIARQLKNRSIRKVVQQRIKEEILI